MLQLLHLLLQPVFGERSQAGVALRRDVRVHDLSCREKKGRGEAQKQQRERNKEGARWLLGWQESALEGSVR